MSSVSNCTFTGIKIDAEMAEAVSSIAEAIKENAIALQKLSDSVDLSNISMDSCLKFVQSEDGYGTQD